MNPSVEEGDFKDYINPDSLQVLPNVYIEPALREAKFNEGYQFIRKGYFVLDEDSSEEKIVFNRTVSLKDAWAKRNPERERQIVFFGSRHLSFIAASLLRSVHLFVLLATRPLP